MGHLRRFRLWSLVLMAVFAVHLLFPIVVMAQAIADIAIAFTEAIDFQDPDPDKQGLTVRLYFTPLDANRKPIVGVKIARAEMLLEEADGGTYQAEVRKADGPIEIVLVLDSSGSMIRNYGNMKTAAAELVDKIANDSTRFSVIAFNHEVRLVQDSTNDKNRVLSVLAALPTPREGDGTCLYGASFQALRYLAEQTGGKPGRRAIIIFSDGVDQARGGLRNPDGSPVPCSRENINDVTTLATQKRFRVPLYTIGFQGARNAPIADADLRNMAQLTGGAVAIGDNLASLFKEIEDAINAQQVAEALTKPREGEREARLRITLDNGQRLNSNTETFVSPRDYSLKTPTPTNTPTQTATFTPTQPATFNLEPPRYDPGRRAFLVQVGGIVSGSLIRDFKVALLQGGVVQTELTVPNPPPPDPVALTLPPNAIGEFVIQVRAFSQDGLVLVERDTQVSFAPTATPTAPPVGAVLKTQRYEDEARKDALIVTLDLLGQERINRLRFAFVDEGNVERLRIDASPAAEVRIGGLDGLRAGQYRLTAAAFDAGGQQLGPTTEIPFTHTYEPTATPTVTPTATAVIPVAVLKQSVQVDRNAEQLIFGVEVFNETLIQRYEVEFIRQDTRESIRTFSIAVPPYNELRVQYGALPSGQYIIELRGLDAEGRRITAPTRIEGFNFQQPTPTPTPVPTETPTPIPSATPLPTDPISVISRALNTPSQAPIVLGIFGLLVVGLGLVFFVLVRRAPKAKTGTGFLNDMTQAELKLTVPPPAPAKRESSATPKPAAKPAAMDVTAPVPTLAADDRTSAVPAMTMPQASLYVQATRHAPLLDKTITITHTPFKIGRKIRDVNFDNDDNVSREHADIVFANGVFYIIDNRSTHGTFINGQRIPAEQQVPIYNESKIQLGTTTILVFRDSGGYDDRTRPEMRR